MATIALIGAVHIGSQIARLAIATGYKVVISNSRGPEGAARAAETAPGYGDRRPISEVLQL